MKLTVIIALLIFYNTYGQFTHGFVYSGQVLDNGFRYVDVGPDGTVFGVIKVGPTKGIYAFDHSDTSFTNMRHDAVPGGRVAVRSDSIVFIIEARDLYAYIYDDTSLTSIGSVTDFDNQFNTSVAIGPGGIIFTTTNFGIRAYSFTESTSFTLLANNINPIFDNATGITVGPDSIVYVAGGGNGFYAFSFYNDSTFTQLDHINVNQASGVAVRSDGTIFFANINTGGVLAYTFNGTFFDSLAQWPVNGARNLAIGNNGTIFIANGSDGLRALTFDGTSFTNTAHIDEGGQTDTRDVAVGPDGVLYVINANLALTAYRYETLTAIGDPEPTSITKFSLSQNYPNPFNPSTKIKFTIPSNVKRETSNVILKVYDVLGNRVATLVNEELSAGEYEVKFDASRLSSGLYFYTLQSGSFTETKKMLLLK